MAAPPLILASTSPARRELLASLKIPFQALAPGVDENVPPETSAHEAVKLLAERKARAVASKVAPESWVIGSDQLVSFEGAVLGKPEDRAAAKDQLQRMAGKTHEICTGLCVIAPVHPAVLELDVAQVTLYSLEEAELERYLDLEEWRGCAGGYRVESAGRALFAGLEGDMTSVQGLPLLRLVRVLRGMGFPFFG
jgi:septum formation protein